MARRQLKHCRAIITGASSGIGRALAQALAREQAKIVLVARREERLQELESEINAAGAECRTVVGDVTSAETRVACVDIAREQFGGLDLLINNAGIGASGNFLHSDESTLRQVMEVNFFALTELTRLALPVLLQGRQPAVVNVGSIIGHHGLPGLSEYSASKGAVRGFSEALRVELVDRVHVMLVSPATTATEFFDQTRRNNDEHSNPQRWKAKRPLTPEAVARTTLKGLRKSKREVFPGMTPKLVRLVNRIVPWLMDYVLESREREARRQSDNAG